MKTFIFCLLLAAVCGENSNSEDFFSVADLDGDGVLQQDEIQADFNKKDINGDGYISLSELIKSFASSWSLEFKMGAFIYYDKLDGNEDGVIDQSAFLSAMKIMDSNGDGEISREEFERNMLKIWNGVAKESKSVLSP
ncbi:calmodulin-4-like isoform X3 [Pomacea canaliculata]|uniref:calmodulin-4-like isoform X3 n=1 Tax=Pomacea canaliculata TaxID=400727 RepID=UPI000D73F441|nr:calmodulin-4-like isoform X3 [Pomacea canaliculata]